MNIIVAAIALATAQPAGSPEAEALGIKLVDMMLPLEASAKLVMQGTQEALAEDPPMSEAEKALFEGVMQEVGLKLARNMNIEAGRAYGARFSVDELERIIAFHETPLGQRLIEASLEITATSLGSWSEEAITQEVSKALCEKDPDYCQPIEGVATGEGASG